MAYTNVWNNANPTGAEAANTIDDIFRSLKLDVTERFDDLFAMPAFTADPLRPYGLKFTDAQDAVISMGDNAGTPRQILVKNKAGAVTYLTLSSVSIIPGQPEIFRDVNDNTIRISGGNAAGTGGNLIVYGATHATKANKLELNASAGVFTSAAFTVGNGLAVTVGTSALQAITATTIVTTSTIAAGAASSIGFTGRSIMMSSADGSIQFRNNANAADSDIACKAAVHTGLISGNSGITISAGTSAFQAVTTTTINASGTITGNLTGNVTGNVTGSSGSTTGNALTATTLQNARLINTVSFNGSADITVTAAAGSLTGTTLNSTVTTASISTLTGGLTLNGTLNSTSDFITTTSISALNITATSIFVGAAFRTISGSGLSVNNATPTTVFTMAVTGQYILGAWETGGGASLVGSCIAMFNDTTSSSAILNGANSGSVSFTVAAGAVKINQTSGSTKTFAWSYIKIS